MRRRAPGAGISFKAGQGVGTVTLAGLPIPPGEPAINPVPRRMMTEAIAGGRGRTRRKSPTRRSRSPIPGGEALARKTWNPRLGIVGGLSILGTTGIVVPFSCAAWIHSIHSGIDVARAAGLEHVAGSTGNTSEEAVRQRYALPDIALLDMGDFAGGLLKYLREHPIPKLTIAGGFAQADEARAGRARPAFLALGGGSRFSRRACARRGRRRCASAGDRAGEHARRKRWRSRRQNGLPLAALVAETGARDGEGSAWRGAGRGQRADRRPRRPRAGGDRTWLGS